MVVSKKTRNAVRLRAQRNLGAYRMVQKNNSITTLCKRLLRVVYQHVRSHTILFIRHIHKPQINQHAAKLLLFCDINKFFCML